MDNKTPQLENGYVRIATEIIEQLAFTKMSTSEWQVLMVVIRKTYGWQKKADKISLTQLQEFTNLTRQGVVNAINKLVNKHILVKSGDGYINVYGVNKDYSTWIVNKRRLVNKRSIDSQQTLTRVVNKRLPKLVNKRRHTIDNKDTNTIDTIQKIYTRFSKISDIDVITLQEIADTYKVPVAFVESKYDDLKNYCLSKGKTYKNYKAALMNWVKRDALQIIQKQNDRSKIKYAGGTD